MFHTVIYDLNYMSTDANIIFCSFMNNTGYEHVSGDVYPCWHTGEKSFSVHIAHCNIIKCGLQKGDLGVFAFS